MKVAPVTTSILEEVHSMLDSLVLFSVSQVPGGVYMFVSMFAGSASQSQDHDIIKLWVTIRAVKQVNK